MEKEFRSIEPYLPNEPLYGETLSVNENSSSPENVERGAEFLREGAAPFALAACEK